MARWGESRMGMNFSEINVACCPPSHLCPCGLLFFKVITTSHYLWFAPLKTPKDFQLSVLGSISWKNSLKNGGGWSLPWCFFLFFMYTISNGSCIDGTEERQYNGRNTWGWPAFETWSGDRAPFLPTLWSGAEKLLDFYINLFESKCSGLDKITPLPCRETKYRKLRAWNTVGLQPRTAFMMLTVIQISHRSKRPSFFFFSCQGRIERGGIFGYE